MRDVAAKARDEAADARDLAAAALERARNTKDGGAASIRRVRLQTERERPPTGPRQQRIASGPRAIASRRWPISAMPTLTT